MSLRFYPLHQVNARRLHKFLALRPVNVADVLRSRRQPQVAEPHLRLWLAQAVDIRHIDAFAVAADKRLELESEHRVERQADIHVSDVDVEMKDPAQPEERVS